MFAWCSASAVEVQFTTLSSRQGLSDDNINAVVQDERGFLWIATEAGLNRYDGYHIETFTHGKYPLALPDDEIVTLALTSGNRIWLGTERGGLILLDIDTMQFQQIAPRDRQAPKLDGVQLSSNTVHAIVPFEDNKLFIGTEGGGLNVYDIDAKSIRYYFVDRSNRDSLCHNEVKVIHKTRDGTLWLGTVDGLNRLDVTTMVFQCFRNEPNNVWSLSNNEVVAIQEDRLGNLWIGTEGGGVNYLEVETGRFSRYLSAADDSLSLSNNEVQTLFIDKEEALWVGTVNGLNRLSNSSELPHSTLVEFEKFWYRQGNRNTINSNVISAIFQDRSGVLWVGSEGGGLNKLIPTSLNQKALTRLSDPLWSGHRISAIFRELDGRLWIGSENSGLYTYNPETRQSQHFDCRRLSCVSHVHLEITALTGNEQNLWFATDGGGLIQYDRVSGTFAAVPLPGVADLAITSLYLDGSHQLWIGTEQNLVLSLVTDSGEIRSYPLTPLEQANAEFGNEVQSLLLDSRQRLWIGTEEYGVLQLNPANKRMRWFNKQTLDGLSSNAINAIAEDQSGRVWLATDLGVNLISPEREEVQKLYVENGLLSNTVTGVVVDEAGDVWVSTNRGINRIQSSSLVISSFDHSDGLMSDFYGRQAIFKDEHGALYFGGNKGIDIIKPMAVTKNARKPNIALTKFNLFNVEQRPGQSKILTQPVYATKQVRLNHNHSVFSLEFVALDQTAPDKNQYAFYLQGFDLGWQQVGAQRTATYTNLPAGDYVFHVKGTNNDGVWSEPLRLGIHIAAAPWKSTWAYSIYLLALISAIYLFIQVKLKRQAEALALANAREEKQRLKENFEMEQRFTANVAHELRTPLAELINMSEVALMWPDDAEIREGFYQDVLDSATQMHQVVNNLLALARCERGLIRLKLSQLDLLDEIAHAWVRHQSYWSKKTISLEVTGADDWHLAGHQAELALILNNIISNAIEYAPTGSAVTIEVDKDSNAIRCCNRMVNPLSPEEIPFIFQRLWRKDGSSAYSEHAGLGMPLIKAYADIIQLQVEVKLIEDRFVLTLSGLAKD